jgi:SAM-dependent methyltransferase
VSGLDEKLRAVGAMWGGADYDRLAQELAPVHDRLVSALDPQPGEHWLDLATGTGEIALRAARRGAVVTGVDISERLLEQARTKAEPEGLELDWVVADVQQLPFEDASFDVVSSSFGVMFAPDSAAVARELGRVCRLRGRLGLTTWRPDEESEALYRTFVDRTPVEQPEVWGNPAALRTLLDGDFELRVESGEWAMELDSPEAAWEFFVASAPPLKALHESLPPERGEQLRTMFLDLRAGHRADGGVRERREYLLVLGGRR